jgi:hypothetical protein
MPNVIVADNFYGEHKCNGTHKVSPGGDGKVYEPIATANPLPITDPLWTIPDTVRYPDADQGPLKAMVFKPMLTQKTGILLSAEMRCIPQAEGENMDLYLVFEFSYKNTDPVLAQVKFSFVVFISKLQDGSGIPIPSHPTIEPEPVSLWILPEESDVLHSTAMIIIDGSYLSDFCLVGIQIRRIVADDDYDGNFNLLGAKLTFQPPPEEPPVESGWYYFILEKFEDYWLGFEWGGETDQLFFEDFESGWSF